MKQVTSNLAAEADRLAAQAVEDGQPLSEVSAYHLHQAAWAAVTGAHVVRVAPAVDSATI